MKIARRASSVPHFGHAVWFPFPPLPFLAPPSFTNGLASFVPILITLFVLLPPPPFPFRNPPSSTPCLAACGPTRTRYSWCSFEKHRVLPAQWGINSFWRRGFDTKWRRKGCKSSADTTKQTRANENLGVQSDFGKGRALVAQPYFSNSIVHASWNRGVVLAMDTCHHQQQDDVWAWRRRAGGSAAAR